jgi:hypothetical protein
MEISRSFSDMNTDTMTFECDGCETITPMQEAVALTVWPGSRLEHLEIMCGPCAAYIVGTGEALVN